MQTGTSTKSVGISTRLTLWIGILVVLILAITSTVSYFKAKIQTHELLKENQLKTMDDVGIIFETYGISKRNGVQYLANRLNQNPDMSEHELMNLLHTLKDLNGYDLVYVGFEDSGKNYQSNDKILDLSQGYDTKNRPWYKQAKAAKQFIVTEPYKSADSGEVGITYAVPFYDKNGNFKGVVGGDYDLAKFSKDVLTVGKSHHTYTTVIDPEGTILFRDDTSRILTKTDLSINIANAIKQNPSYIDPNNRDVLFNAKDDKGINHAIMCNTTYNPLFRICTVTEDSVYTDTANEILYQQVIIGIVAIVIALILVRFLINRSFSPLASIQAGLNSFFDFINHKT
ncbi:TPA: PDC sensor domain-containing protein, partial [Campylobacter coli]|nr:PDC sensor domain-containing protein [Campylobacter coli]